MARIAICQSAQRSVQRHMPLVLVGAFIGYDAVRTRRRPYWITRVTR